MAHRRTPSATSPPSAPSSPSPPQVRHVLPVPHVPPEGRMSARRPEAGRWSGDRGDGTALDPHGPLRGAAGLRGVARGAPVRGGRTAPGRRAAVAAVAHTLHALMALAMGAMVWPRGMELPARPQIVLFALAALWFPVAAVVWSGEHGPRGVRCCARSPRAGDGRDGLDAAGDVRRVRRHGSRRHEPRRRGPRRRGGSGPAMADVPGMPVAGTGLSGASGDTTMSLTGAGPRATAGVLALVFLLLALWWLTRGFDRARERGPAESDVERLEDGAAGEHGAYDLVCHGVMALGMAVMFVVMV
ncbi:DUF5134 domain-containing protein [Streptomyces sp. M19]